jgi:hypothetical protein
LSCWRRSVLTLQEYVPQHRIFYTSLTY